MRFIVISSKRLKNTCPGCIARHQIVIPAATNLCREVIFAGFFSGINVGAQ